MVYLDSPSLPPCHHTRAPAPPTSCFLAFPSCHDSATGTWKPHPSRANDEISTAATSLTDHARRLAFISDFRALPMALPGCAFWCFAVFFLCYWNREKHVKTGNNIGKCGIKMKKTRTQPITNRPSCGENTGVGKPQPPRYVDPRPRPPAKAKKAHPRDRDAPRPGSGAVGAWAWACNPPTPPVRGALFK